MQYCTVAQLIETIQVLQSDINNEFSTIPEPALSSIIDEASVRVDSILQPNYNVSVIQAYTPDFPPSVVYLTRIEACILTLDRFGLISQERNETIVNMVQKEKDFWLKIVAQGLITDIDGNTVAKKSTPAFVTSEILNTKIRDLYPDGASRFY